MTPTDHLAVVHVVSSLLSKGGGLPRTVVHTTDALAKTAEVGVTLLSQCLIGEMTLPSTRAVDRRESVSASRISLTFGCPGRAELERVVRDASPALFHSHGIWTPVNHWTSIAAGRNRIPLIVQPHGMLAPWALRHKLWKKRLAMAMFQRRDLDAARLLVATSSAEYENIRGLGLRQPVAVIPNGVDLNVGPLPAKATQTDRQRVALFLSRVHPVKGLLNLVSAWAQLAPVGWRLCIAGPDEVGHLKEVLALVRQLGVEDSVDYVGAVDGAAKSALYNAADVFVLPSFTENFGVVVAEALAHGLPVITTRGAPWADLQTYGCGWWVDIGVDPLAQALRAAMGLNDDERRAMGARGRAYVWRYAWDDIAQQTIDVYRWVLGDQPKPDCVQLD